MNQIHVHVHVRSIPEPGWLKPHVRRVNGEWRASFEHFHATHLTSNDGAYQRLRAFVYLATTGRVHLDPSRPFTPRTTTT